MRAERLHYSEWIQTLLGQEDKRQKKTKKQKHLCNKRAVPVSRVHGLSKACMRLATGKRNIFQMSQRFSNISNKLPGLKHAKETKHSHRHYWSTFFVAKTPFCYTFRINTQATILLICTQLKIIFLSQTGRFQHLQLICEDIITVTIGV